MNGERVGRSGRPMVKSDCMTCCSILIAIIILRSASCHMLSNYGNVGSIRDIRRLHDAARVCNTDGPTRLRPILTIACRVISLSVKVSV